MVQYHAVHIPVGTPVHKSCHACWLDSDLISSLVSSPSHLLHNCMCASCLVGQPLHRKGRVWYHAYNNYASCTTAAQSDCASHTLLFL